MEQTHRSLPEQPATSADRRQRTTRWLLVAGDTLAFLVFAAIGRRSHGETAGLGALLEIAWTAAPFWLGWLLTAPWTGGYRLPLNWFADDAAATRPVRQFARQTALAWLVALPVGLVLRAYFLQRSIPLSFALVTFLSNLVLLVGWRSVIIWLRTRHAR